MISLEESKVKHRMSANNKDIIRMHFGYYHSTNHCFFCEQ